MGKSPAWFGKRQCIQGIAFHIFQAGQIVSGILKMYISDQKQIPPFEKKNATPSTTTESFIFYLVITSNRFLWNPPCRDYYLMH